MTSPTFLQLDLILHITGFTMMAGTILETTAGFGRLIGIGAALLKMVLVLLVILNGTLVLQRGSSRLKQPLLFLLIFILSILRF
jgi:hypothetical protein